MKIIVHGASGSMGTIICKMIEETDGFSLAAAAAIDYPEDTLPPKYKNLSDYTGEADCLIDFSHHTAADCIMSYAKERGLPVVLATTGHTEDELEIIKSASETVPVFMSANMSVGVAMLVKLAKEAAKMFPDADIEIVECHHNRKYDVPSGTALMLARGIQEVRPDSELVIGRHENGRRRKSEIGIHSLRIGNVVGMHEVIISTGAQTLTLKHEAESRALFAEGALAAAEFIVGKPAGLYNMDDMLAE